MRTGGTHSEFDVTPGDRASCWGGGGGGGGEGGGGGGRGVCVAPKVPKSFCRNIVMLLIKP